MGKFNVEQQWWFDDKDDDMDVKVEWRFPYSSTDRDVNIKFGAANVEMTMTLPQAKEFAENLISGIMNLSDKDKQYSGDKTKGDAFEALRRDEQ